jgi:hypothetical protein
MLATADKEQRRQYQEAVFKRLQYDPTVEQWLVHGDGHRIKQVSGGERGGKSVVGEKDALLQVPFSTLGWIAAIDYETCRTEFEYMKKDLVTLGLVNTKDISYPKDGKCQMVTMTGCKIETVSLDEIRKIGRVAPDWILVCEGAQIDFPTYLKLRGRIAEKRGVMILTGTMEGCLVGDTIVFTSDGIKTLDSMSGQTLEVAGINGKAAISKFHFNGIKPVVKLNLEKSFEITGTLDHKVIVRLKDGSVTWKALDEINDTDIVAIRYDTQLFGKNHLDPDFAYFAGVYIAEGCCDESDRVTITNIDPQIITRACPGYYQHGKYHHRLTDHERVRKLKEIGIDIKWKARTKQIPTGILNADKETQVNFLQGLFDGDGSATKVVVYYSSNRKMIRQIQMMLLNMGVLSSIQKRIQIFKGKEFDGYVLSVCDAEIFTKEVGFYLKRKQDKALTLKSPSFIRKQCNSGNEFLGYPVCWVSVKSKEYSEEETFDITVPDGHAYSANGLIVHNSLGWWPEYIKRGQAPDTEFKSFIIPSWTNHKVFPPEGYSITLMNGVIVENVSKEIYDLWVETPLDVFMERYGAVPQPVAGLVAREFSNAIHVGDYPYDPGIPVEIAVDPGYAGAYAVLAIQIKESQPYVVDEIYTQGHTTEDVITDMKQRPWGNAVSQGAIDIAARQHQAMAAPVEVWRDKVGIFLQSQYVDVEAGIELFRTFLKVNPVTGRPKMYINTSCRGLIAECGGGKSPVQGGGAYIRDIRTGKLIDANNHAFKAFVYWAVNRFGYTATKVNLKIKSLRY